MKRFIALVLLILLLLTTCNNVFAENGFDNFKDTKTYTSKTFSDVKDTDWFASYVRTVYEKNLMSGTGSGFNVTGNVSIAETITVACRLHNIYNGGSASFEAVSGPWYQTFVDYAAKNGITTKVYDSYTRAATRAEYATIIANALPDEAFVSIGNIPDNAVPDVPMTAEYAKAVYKLYRAGIISGSDEKGTFKPQSNIKRSEVATILSRIVEPTLRSAIKLESKEQKTSSDFSFEIRFLDVGQGDASLILCDGHAMLIDGGDRTCSSQVYTVLKNNNITHLDYMVATHPDADHVGGLSGALNYATVGTAFCTTDTHDTAIFANFKTYLAKQGIGITIPKAGDSFYLGSAKVTVLAPTSGQLSDNTSIVLRIEYGETSFLFTGDAEYEDEKAMIESGAKLESTVLKVAHHGSNSSTCYSFLYYVNPEYSVISVGGDNEYGHPTENVLSRLKDQGCKLYRTDINGDVVCKSDGKNVTFTVEKNASVDTFSYAGGYANSQQKAEEQKKTETQAKEQTQQSPATYVVNLNSKKFHEASCSSVSKMADKNKWVYTGTREWLIENGYTPCKICNP